jgi:SulP family sulfate permease
VLLLLGRFSRPSGSSMERLPNGEAFAPPDTVPGTTTEPGLLVYRPDLPLSFVNTTWVLDLVREEISRQPAPPSVVVLDLDATPELDVSGVDFLISLHRELEHDNQELWLSRVNPRVRAVITDGELRDVIGEGRHWSTNRDALQAFRHRSDPSGAAGNGAAPP